jgi:hypothetical protein
MQYFSWEGGIGNNPESYTSNGNYIYIASPNSGVFLRISGDGCDPISSIYSFDKATKALMTLIQQYKLSLIAGFDRENDEVLWTLPPYIAYLFNGIFDPNAWSTVQDITPAGTVPIIITQPANGTVTYDPVANNFVINMNAGFLGNDGFTYRLKLPDNSLTAIKNECITVVVPAIRPKGYRARASSVYCVQVQYTPTVNNFTLYTSYGMTITDVYGNTATGVPPSFTGINLLPGQTASANAASVSGGSIRARLIGHPVLPNVWITLYVNNISVWTLQVIDGVTLYDLVNPSTVNYPSTLYIQTELH